jgi:hypothetical protein
MTDASPPPKAKGGRRSGFSGHNSEATRWKKGQCGNPHPGRSASQMEFQRLARLAGPDNIDWLIKTRDDPTIPAQVRFLCVKELNERGYGKAPFAVAIAPMLEIENAPDGEPMTPLLKAAHHSDREKRIRDLEAELARLRREERTEHEVHETEDAYDRGQPNTNAMRLLMAVRDEPE